MSKSLRVLVTVSGLVVLMVLVVGWGEAAENRSTLTTDEIARAQEILVKEQLLGPGDYRRGVVDVPTEKALRAFQDQHSLNGSVGLDDETYRMLLTHEMAFPWDNPTPTFLAASEPVAPPPAPVEEEPVITEAPPVPPATPAPVVVEKKEEPKEDPVMPVTASPLPAWLLLGVLMVSGGLLLLRPRRS